MSILLAIVDVYFVIGLAFRSAISVNVIGIVANAFTSEGCRGGDGVEIKVSGDTGATLAFPYNPFADATLRPARRFELGPVEVGLDGTLLLDLAPGPANNADCDWAYLRDVSIHAVEHADLAR